MQLSALDLGEENNGKMIKELEQKKKGKNFSLSAQSIAKYCLQHQWSSLVGLIPMIYQVKIFVIQFWVWKNE